MKSTDVIVRLNIWVQCPECECTQDLNDSEHAELMKELIFKRSKDELGVVCITCNSCFKRFNLGDVTFNSRI